jgi:hypothetical protein
MAFIFTFDFVIEMLAAFVIFVIGYLALFVSLMICLAVLRGIYEGVKRVRAYAVGSASANSVSTDAERELVITNQ